jgi:tRNA(Arg) A34 adenosine deaminase TadA
MPFLRQGRFEVKYGNKIKGQACFILLFLIFLSFYGCSHINSNSSTSAGAGLAKDIKFHEPFIRQTYELAVSAGKKGNHPFGALLVHQGKVILTAENTVNTDKDNTNHAETNLLLKAKHELPAEVIRQSTMYISTAPCMMCSTVMWYMGISKMVYGVSYESFARLAGFEDKGISCEQIYRKNGAALEWMGPVLEKEGLQVFHYWPPGDPLSQRLRKN